MSWAVASYVTITGWLANFIRRNPTIGTFDLSSEAIEKSHVTYDQPPSSLLHPPLFQI